MNEAPRGSLLSSIESECLPFIERHTVPMFFHMNGSTALDRSCVLYRSADCYFLFTATHKTLSALRSFGANYLFLRPTERIDDIVPLSKCTLHHTEHDGVSRDVAAIKLSEETVRLISPHKDFLTHNRIGQGDDGKGQYLVFGYPCEWGGFIENGIRAEPMVYIAKEFEGSKEVSVAYDPRLHLRLDFRGEKHDPQTGAYCPMPSLHGLSGCGIWRVTSHPTNFDNWTAAQLRLVATVTHTDPEKNFIQGTRITFALDLILANYPELGKAMDLIYPPSSLL